MAALLGCVAALLGCTPGRPDSITHRRSASAPITAPVTTSSTATTQTMVRLVPWTGPVEHLFFHTLVIRPELAFTRDRLGQGFRDYFVTVGEFKSILNELYANDWTLVDIHRAEAGGVDVPPGRKPLVISEDDVNYYNYERGRGLGGKLVLDGAGNVAVEERDEHGTRITDNDLIPLVDKFVASHPLFSAGGAKGVLAVTGYEGFFGERTQDTTDPGWPNAVARARAVAARLQTTGWTIASHSWGHIDLTKASLGWAEQDTQRWLTEAAPILRTTDIYVYPFGAAPPPTSPIVEMLHAKGFTVLCDIDITPRMDHVDGVVVMSRRHIDGIAFTDQVKALAPFFAVTNVEDTISRRQ